MLDVVPTASADEIKRAFRREIAKYHPDKVQHLGQEFQEIAAVKAAELTQAYQTLCDPAVRAEYDARLGETPAPAPPAAVRPPSHPEAQTSASPRPAPPTEPVGQPSSASSVFSQERAGASALVQRATVIRFRQALEGEFGRFDEVPVAGFDVTCVPKPAFFSLKLPPRVLGRFVDRVDGPTLTETW